MRKGRTSQSAGRSTKPRTSCRRIKRNVLAELLLEQFEQPPPVSRFLLAHAFKHRCGCRIVLPQPFGKVSVYALVFFFQTNCQSKNFAFRKIFELFHVAIAYLPAQVRDNLDSPFFIAIARSAIDSGISVANRNGRRELCRMLLSSE